MSRYVPGKHAARFRVFCPDPNTARQIDGPCSNSKCTEPLLDTPEELYLIYRDLSDPSEHGMDLENGTNAIDSQPDVRAVPALVT